MLEQDNKTPDSGTPPDDEKIVAGVEDNKEKGGDDESDKDEKGEEGKKGEEAKEAPKTEEKAPRRDRAQERINEITKSRRIAEADADRIRGILKDVTGEEPPKPSNFKKIEEYNEAFLEYATSVKIPQAQLKDIEAKIGQHDQEYIDTVVEAWDDKIEAEKAEDPEWEKTVKSARIKLPAQLTLALMEMPKSIGPKVVKYLAQNQDEAHDLITMSPAAQLRRLGFLESKVQNAAPKDASSKRKAEPNEPPDDVVKGKGGSSGSKDPSKMSMAEYRKFRGQ